MSNNKSLTFPLILSVIALILWLGASFLGFIYPGNPIFVAVLFTLAVLVFMGLGLFLLIWTTKTRNINQGQKRIIRIVSWIIYIAGSLVSFYFLNHGIKVTATVKGEVQRDLNVQIEDIRTVYSSDYHTTNSYAEYYHKQLEYYVNSLGDISDDEKNLEWKSLKGKIENTCLDSLDISSSYKVTRDEVMEKTDGYLKSINSWNPFKINSVVSEFYYYKVKWVGNMDRFYTVTEYTAKAPFEYTYKEDSCSYIKLQRTDFVLAWQAIAVAIILQILLLLPVLMTKDWSAGARRAKNVTTI